MQNTRQHFSIFKSVSLAAALLLGSVPISAAVLPAAQSWSTDTSGMEAQSAALQAANNEFVYAFDFTARVTYSDGSLSGVTEGTLIEGNFQGVGPGSIYAVFGGTNYTDEYRFQSGQVSATFAGHTLTAKNPGIRIYDDMGGNVEDGFSMSSGYTMTVDDTTYSNGAFGFNLTTRPGNTGVIHDLSLPSEVIVSEFDGHSSLTYGYMQRHGGPGGYILGFEVLSVNMVSVPEPTTYALMGLGLLGVAGAVRRKR